MGSKFKETDKCVMMDSWTNGRTDDKEMISKGHADDTGHLFPEK